MQIRKRPEVAAPRGREPPGVSRVSQAHAGSREKIVIHTNRTGDVVGQDAEIGEDDDTPGIGQPLSQAEIEELLYNDAWSAEIRLERLRAFRDELMSREAADFGAADPHTLLREVEAAIASLEAPGGEEMDPASIDHNPGDHRETLAPDSDELEAIEEEDQASLAEDLPEDLMPGRSE